VKCFLTTGVTYFLFATCGFQKVTVTRSVRMASNTCGQNAFNKKKRGLTEGHSTGAKKPTKEIFSSER